MLSSYESGFDNDQDNLREQQTYEPWTADSRQAEAAGNRTEQVDKPEPCRFRIPDRANRPERAGGGRIGPGRSVSMLMTKERRPAIRTLRGSAINVLQEAGAIHECEEHGWAKDRPYPHAREHALDVARQDPPAGVSPDDIVAEVSEVLNSVGASPTKPSLSPRQRWRRAGPKGRPQRRFHLTPTAT
jgi:hypothetical protein